MRDVSVNRMAGSPRRARRNNARYGWVAQALHWLTAVLVAVQIGLGIAAHQQPISLERLILLARHKSVGLAILAVVILRLGWRLYAPPPPLPPQLPHRIHLAAHSTHWTLYGLLIIMPLVGWASSSAANIRVSFFGLFELPNLIGGDKPLTHLLVLAHTGMAWTLMVIVTIHIVAALWHHFLRKDDVLRRMLPGHETVRRLKND